MFGPTRELHLELQQRTADAIDARAALLLVSFAESMQFHLTSLLRAFDRHVVHMRAFVCLADGGCIVGVVLAALAGQ